ncbi:MAG: glycosyltransferase family 87 protein [Chloroflexota bacterium]
MPPRDRLLAAALPSLAIVALVTVVAAASLSSARAGTLGFDFLSYDLAVRRFLDGGVLYDQAFDYTGAFGLFYYPPPFVLFAAPLAVLEPMLAAWIWTAALVAAFAVGVALLPVDRRTRWLILLLGAISWPLVYAIKLGQVGPILLVTFAMGWRWMDRPWRFGAATALGTAIKIQPALLFAWALVTGRRRAVVAGAAILAVLALAATLVAGPSSWIDQATLLARVSRPIDTPHNMTPGRLAFEAGLGQGLAWAIQIANWALVALVVLVAMVRCSPVASYLAVVVATQLVSPILWDHYALVLLVPVAWLVSRGRRWTVVIPLATSIVFVGAIPPLAYPLAYWVTLGMVVREGWDRRRKTLPPQASAETGAMLRP